MIHDADAIVVGSGPAGVSVALPLVESGMRLILLDGGRRRDEGLVPRGAYHDLRRGDAGQWRLFLGPRLEALRAAGPPSPKFRAPSSLFAFDGFDDAVAAEGSRFTLAGSLARGGFSTIWGAGLGLYDAEDLAEFPVTVRDLAPSYRRIAARIGVSGFGDDDLATELDAEIAGQPPMRLAENARRLLSRYADRRAALHACGVRLGRPRIAVLTAPLAGRGACELCDACLWGCAHGSIWSAEPDLAALAEHGNLDYRPGHLATRIERVDRGYRVSLSSVDAGGVRREAQLAAPRLVLAAGTLGTTRLVLDLERRYDEPVPLRSSPTAAFALCLPERIGEAIAAREFSMAQLSFTARLGSDRAYGNLFAASGIPGSFLVERMPLTRPGAIRLLRLLQPALLLGNCFLPGGHSRHSVTLARPPGAPRACLVVRDGTDPALAAQFGRLKRSLARAFRRLGAPMLPRSFTPAEPGSDLRYSGTLPMRRDPGPREVDPTGRLHGHDGLYVVDLSIFPAMGAKHPTLTLMANADRIGRAIAARG